MSKPARTGQDAAAEISAHTDRPEVSELPKLPCSRLKR